MNITQLAKALMDEKDWTQKRLAEEVGIHPITLCRLLSHPEKRPVTAYDKLVEYLLVNSPPELTAAPARPQPCQERETPL